MKKTRNSILFACALATAYLAYSRFDNGGEIARVYAETGAAYEKDISLREGGAAYPVTTTAETVDDVLKEHGIMIGDGDKVFPGREQKISSGMTIVVSRRKSMTLFDGQTKRDITAYADSVRDVLAENGVALAEFDIVVPKRGEAVPDKGKIAITRVNIERATVPEDISFEKISKEDDELSWRKKVIEQKGERGIREVTYEIVSHNGKEINRKVIGKKVTKEPVKEIFVQGTFMKLKKADTGWGTWYTQPKRMVHSYPQENGMTAASPWIAIGQYVKVTNKENGKSVVVRINDRGPFGKNRIIDLNTPAFQKIASLGAGVIDVKVEEILN